MYVYGSIMVTIYQSKSAYILSIPFDITLFYMETGNTHEVLNWALNAEVTNWLYTICATDLGLPTKP